VTNFSSLGLQAISDAQPAGNDVRDEADFDLLQNEIAKMSNPVTSGTLDWQQVVQLSATLLADKGKDILVACYLAGGLLQTRGLPGLLDGMQVLNDMLQTYWDTLYPPLQRLRGRRNALQWLIERIKLHGEETDWSALPPQEPALVEGLREALKAIDALLVDKDSDAPSLRPAISQVNTIPVQEIVPDPVNDDSASAQKTVSSSAASAAGAAAAAGMIIALDSAEHVEQASTAALEKLSDIADWLSESEMNKPLAFRLKRVAVWANIENLPLLRGGQTLLPGPIPQIQDVLRKLLNSQSNEDLIRFAEAQLTLFPFWLDLNCITAQAMERLGESFDAARHEVCGETARLLGRLPGLEQMAFVGGMPFANAETLQWLQWLQALHTAANGTGGADGTDGTSGIGAGGNGAKPDSLQKALAGARALAAENDVAGAAAGLQKAIDQTSAPRGKLQLRIHLCELLFAQRPGANLDAFARALIAEIDRFELQTWDPPLALGGLQAAYNIVARNDEAKSEADVLLARIVALDASAAVKLVT
jgi:type VI secretion system protein VasJ